MMDHLIDLLELIIEKNLGAVTVVKIFGLSLPFLMALSVPASVLTASIMSFGRLSTDNEIVAFKSCGINIFSLLKPTVAASLILSFFMVYFNNEILPSANHKLKNLLLQANYRKPITALKQGQFTKIDRFTVYVSENTGEELKGIVIYEHDKSVFPEMITAEHGNIDLYNGGNSLQATLYNGEMYNRDEKDNAKFEIRKFKKFVLNRPDLGFDTQKVNSNYHSDRELSSKELWSRIEKEKKYISEKKERIKKVENKIADLKADSLAFNYKSNLNKQIKLIDVANANIKIHQEDIMRYKVEIHKKYAIAFACFLFVLIGAPVGMMTRTSGIGMAVSVSSFVFLLYYLMLIGGEELADRGIVSPFLAMWIANILIAFSGVYLVIRSMKEDKVIDLGKIFLKIGKKIPFLKKKIH